MTGNSTMSASYTGKISTTDTVALGDNTARNETGSETVPEVSLI